MSRLTDKIPVSSGELEGFNVMDQKGRTTLLDLLGPDLLRTLSVACHNGRCITDDWGTPYRRKPVLYKRQKVNPFPEISVVVHPSTEPPPRWNGPLGRSALRQSLPFSPREPAAVPGSRTKLRQKHTTENFRTVISASRAHSVDAHWASQIYQSCCSGL